MGAKLLSFRQEATGADGGGDGSGGPGLVALEFEGQGTPVTASVVVGADGYWSKVGGGVGREGLQGNQKKVEQRGLGKEDWARGMAWPRGGPCEVSSKALL